jgi:hypothetical protein
MVAAVAAAGLLPLLGLLAALCRRLKDPVKEIITEAVRRASLHPKPAAPKWKPADVYRHQADAWTGSRETKEEPDEPKKGGGKSKWKCSDVYNTQTEPPTAATLLKRPGTGSTTASDPPPPYQTPKTPRSRTNPT